MYISMALLLGTKAIYSLAYGIRDAPAWMLWRRRDFNQNKLVSVWSLSALPRDRGEGGRVRVSAVSIPFRHATKTTTMMCARQKEGGEAEGGRRQVLWLTSAPPIPPSVHGAAN